eukprot:308902-Chlamydomonas_euryale.AAC.1
MGIPNPRQLDDPICCPTLGGAGRSAGPLRRGGGCAQGGRRRQRHGALLHEKRVGRGGHPLQVVVGRAGVRQGRDAQGCSRAAAQVRLGGPVARHAGLSHGDLRPVERVHAGRAQGVPRAH